MVAIADWFLGWSGYPDEDATGDFPEFFCIFIADPPPDGILIGDTELLLLPTPTACIYWFK
jgi:hypothetical protein